MTTKKKYIITAGVILFISFILIIAYVFITSYGAPFELKIKSAIKEANYCNVDSDCVSVGNSCPFSCNIYVNKNEVKQISELLESFHSKCAYTDCATCPTAECKNSRCKKVCE